MCFVAMISWVLPFVPCVLCHLSSLRRTPPFPSCFLLPSFCIIFLSFFLVFYLSVIYLFTFVPKKNVAQKVLLEETMRELEHKTELLVDARDYIATLEAEHGEGLSFKDLSTRYILLSCHCRFAHLSLTLSPLSPLAPPRPPFASFFSPTPLLPF